MDKLRAAVTDLTERAARSRLAVWLRSLQRPQDGADDAQRGQGLAEYSLILAGIAVVAIASLIFLGGTISDMFWAPINEEFGEVLSRLGI